MKIRIEGFEDVFNEVVFVDMQPQNGGYEPLLGYVILEQSQVAVDLVGHRLVKVKHADLKYMSISDSPIVTVTPIARKAPRPLALRAAWRPSR